MLVAAEIGVGTDRVHWTRFVGHLLVNAGDHAMAD